MSFNGSGTYVLPAGQPVVSGTVISSATFNTYTSDVGNALNLCVTRDGQGVMSTQFKLIDGTVSIPGVGFNSESSTGFYRASAGVLAVAVLGAQVATFSSTGLTVTGVVSGAALIPSGSSIPTNGMYLPSSNAVGFATNTTARGSISANGNWSMLTPTSGTTLAVSGVGSATTNPLTISVTSGNYGVIVTPSVTSQTPGIMLSDTSLVRKLEILSNGSAASTVYGAAASTQVINAQGGLTLSTNDSARLTIGSTGIVTINSSGASTNSLVVNGNSGGSGILISGAASDAARLLLTDGHAGTHSYVVGAGISNTGTFDVYDASVGSTRLSISTVGAITINAPSSGAGLTIGDTTNGKTSLVASDVTFSIGQVISPNIREIISTAAQPLYFGTSSSSAAATLTFCTSSVGRVQISSTGDITIASLGTGTVYSNASILTNTNPSDSRLKTGITDLSYGLSAILQLRPVTYKWKDDRANQGSQFGFIAQEVQSVIPEAIKAFKHPGDETEYLGLEKDAIYSALVKAIQQLKAEFDAYVSTHP